MQRATAGFTAAVHTARGIVTGGYLIAAVLLLVVVHFSVLFYAPFLGGGRRQPRADVDEMPLDRSEVIGSFPPRQVGGADLTGVVQAIGKTGSGRPGPS